MKLLAIRLGYQKTIAKSLVMSPLGPGSRRVPQTLQRGHPGRLHGRVAQADDPGNA